MWGIVREEVGESEVSPDGVGVDYGIGRGAGWRVGVLPLYAGWSRVVSVDVEASFAPNYCPAGRQRAPVVPWVIRLHD